MHRKKRKQKRKELKKKQERKKRKLKEKQRKKRKRKEKKTIYGWCYSSNVIFFSTICSCLRRSCLKKALGINYFPVSASEFILFNSLHFKQELD